ncbi:hypothetical protein EDD11_008654 [Mortierella claussenii]|nr:hypothetical protein EDD11_008654 [Mortierella claussenii]
MIAKRLSIRDLKMLMATCKSLAMQLEPVLFASTIVLPQYVKPDTLKRNWTHIRHIDLSMIKAEWPVHLSQQDLLSALTADSQLQSSPQLAKQLGTSASGSVFLQQNNLHTIDVNRVVGSRLTVLRLNFDFRRPNTTLVPHIIEAIDQNLSNLEHLFVLGRYASLEMSLKWLEVGLRHPRLVQLEFDFTDDGTTPSYLIPPLPSVKDWTNLLNSVSEAQERHHQNAINQGRFSKKGQHLGRSRIRHFQPPDSIAVYPASFLYSLFSVYLPNVEEYYLPEHVENDCEELMERSLVESFGRIQHLHCGSFPDSRFRHMDTVKRFLEVCSGSEGLKSFSCRWFNDCIEPSEAADSVGQTLIRHHSKSLEEINLLWTSCLHSKTIQAWLESCDKLTSFRVETFLSEVSIDFQDIISKEWVCTELKALELTLSRKGISDADLLYDFFIRAGGDHDDLENMEDIDIEGSVSGHRSGGCSGNRTFDLMSAAVDAVAQFVGEKVYSQIGRLVKLEYLSLGCDLHESAFANAASFEWDLTLNKGWLVQLNDLKQLKHFMMVADFWSQMGFPEVQFMAENWPQLERLTFGHYPMAASEEKGWEKPHWKWLQKQRPGIVYDTMCQDE